jgi:hypothetical protein
MPCAVQYYVHVAAASDVPLVFLMGKHCSAAFRLVVGGTQPQWTVCTCKSEDGKGARRKPEALLVFAMKSIL